METQIIIDQIVDGEISPEMGYARLKDMEKQIAEAIKQVQPTVFNYLWQFGKSELEGMGYRSVMRTTYTYNENEQWQGLEAEKKELEKLLKMATDKQKPFVHPDTGEVLNPVTPKYSESFQYLWKK